MKNLRIHPPKTDKPTRQEEEGRKKRIIDPDRKPCTYCKDFRLGYWIVWNGYMRFCSFMNGPNIPVRDKSFKECWQELVKFRKTPVAGRMQDMRAERKLCKMCGTV